MRFAFKKIKMIRLLPLLTLDHVCHRLAGDVKETLNIIYNITNYRENKKASYLRW